MRELAILMPERMRTKSQFYWVFIEGMHALVRLLVSKIGMNVRRWTRDWVEFWKSLDGGG
jgi:hypothetical protein